MEIKIIGSGSSGNCYRISDGKTPLLLDAGIPVKKISKALNFQLSEIAGALITHEHGDHCLAVNDLANKYGIKIYTSAGTIEGSQGHAWAIKTPAVKILKAMKPTEIGSWAILPFETEHDAEEPLGFLLKSHQTGEKLLYFTDTYYLKYRFKGITHMMAECNYTAEGLNRSMQAGNIAPTQAKRILQSHMSLEHLKDFLEAIDRSQLQQIYLIHISKSNGEKDRMAREIRKITGVEVYA